MDVVTQDVQSYYFIFVSAIIIMSSYLLGSIPCGFLIMRYIKKIDIRQTGSGNIGATNVMRAGKKSLALITFLLDALKGGAAVIIALLLEPGLYQVAGMVAVIGHIFPVWLGFKGGKGVATIFGVLLFLSLPLALITLITWGTIASIWRYSSLAALVSIGLTPLYTYVLSGDEFILTTLAFTLIVIITHKDNIYRLLSGRESKIGDSSTSTHASRSRDS